MHVQWAAPITTHQILRAAQIGQPTKTSHNVPSSGASIVTFTIVLVPSKFTLAEPEPETSPPVLKIVLPSNSMERLSGTVYISYETGKVPDGLSMSMFRTANP